MESRTQPDEATREAESAETQQAHSPDRPPTGEEEAAAERGRNEDEEEELAVEEHFREMTDIGSHLKGEGSPE